MLVNDFSTLLIITIRTEEERAILQWARSILKERKKSKGQATEKKSKGQKKRKASDRREEGQATEKKSKRQKKRRRTLQLYF